MTKRHKARLILIVLALLSVFWGIAFLAALLWPLIRMFLKIRPNEFQIKTLPTGRIV